MAAMSSSVDARKAAKFSARNGISLIRTVKNAQALAAGICLPHVCISGKYFFHEKNALPDSNA
jgi:hypothetical protein